MEIKDGKDLLSLLDHSQGPCRLIPCSAFVSTTSGLISSVSSSEQKGGRDSGVCLPHWTKIMWLEFSELLGWPLACLERVWIPQGLAQKKQAASRKKAFRELFTCLCLSWVTHCLPEALRHQPFCKWIAMKERERPGVPGLVLKQDQPSPQRTQLSLTSVALAWSALN